MKIYPVTDPAFTPYGKVLAGYDMLRPDRVK